MTNPAIARETVQESDGTGAQIGMPASRHRPLARPSIGEMTEVSATTMQAAY